MIDQDSVAGVPFCNDSAVITLRKMFNERPHWKRSDLVKALPGEHAKAGGVLGRGKPEGVAKHAIKRMCKRGEIEKVAFATYRKSESHRTDSECGEPKHGGELKPIKVIGEGTESVYVYYAPYMKELAELKGQQTWLCKIGRTSGLATDRIYAQGVRTSMMAEPVVGLVIKTNHSVLIEKTLHCVLTYFKCWSTGCPGDEWFITNPSIVEQCYERVLGMGDMFGG